MNRTTAAKLTAIALLCCGCSGCLITAGMAATGTLIRHSRATKPADASDSVPVNASSTYAAALDVLAENGTVEESNAKDLSVTATDWTKNWRYNIVVKPAKNNATSVVDSKVELIGKWDSQLVGNTTTADQQSVFIYRLSKQLGGVSINPVTK